MDGLEKIIEYIRAESDAQCEQIVRKAEDECRRIHDEYARIEQEEYWKYIDAGTKETEHRVEQLNSLADKEANKLIAATQQEMVAEAFSLAAKKLRQLPKHKYTELLAQHGLGPGDNVEEVVARYRPELTPRVTSTLFS